MIVPWLMQFSLIIPCNNVNFWMLRYFKDCSNQDHVKQGPAVMGRRGSKSGRIYWLYTSMVYTQEIRVVSNTSMLY